MIYYTVLIHSINAGYTHVGLFLTLYRKFKFLPFSLMNILINNNRYIFEVLKIMTTLMLCSIFFLPQSRHL